MVLLRAPCSAILSPLQPSIYTHLTHGLAAGIRDRLLEQRRWLRLETKLRQHGSDGEGGCDAMAVLDLERDAQSLADQRGAVHALPADFGDDATRMRAHQLRTRSALTGDEIRVVKHGFSDSGNGKRETGNVNVSTCPVSRCTFPEFRICQRHIPQRERKRRDATTIDRHSDVVGWHAAVVADPLQT